MRSGAWLVLPVAALAAGTLAAATVLADSQRVLDAPGDGHSGCEILAATAGHAAGGRLKHTITMADAIQDTSVAPIVLIRAKPSEVGRAPRFTLSPGSPGVSTRRSTDRKTVTYTIKAAGLRSEMEVPKTRRSYFWSANGCFQYPDWAPDTSSGREQVKAHRFQP
jgi:hypothetical protein